MTDVIKLDIPLFLRLLELAREDVKDDADLHDIAQIVAELSQDGVVDMSKYNEILDFMKTQGSENQKSTAEILRIRQLGGL
jgi:hypothetical protein